MAISEKTKQLAASERGRLGSQVDEIDREIDHLEKAVKALESQKVGVKAAIDALKNDIPEPTPLPSDL